MTDARWDVYPDKRAESLIEQYPSEAGRQVLEYTLQSLAQQGPAIFGARLYRPPYPQIIWRAPIRQPGAGVFGGLEYIEEPSQRIRVTWVAWLPYR